LRLRNRHPHAGFEVTIDFPAMEKRTFR